MSKHRHIELTDEQRQQLNNLVRSGSGKARKLTRARILLLADRSPAACNARRVDQDIADALLCSKGTVRNVRHRFLDEGLEAALNEKPRPGASVRPKITGEVEAHLIAAACSAPPDGHARWTLTLLADRMVELGLVESLTSNAVGQRLRSLKKDKKSGKGGA
jgi:hypothetical protein